MRAYKDEDAGHRMSPRVIDANDKSMTSRGETYLTVVCETDEEAVALIKLVRKHTKKECRDEEAVALIKLVRKHTKKESLEIWDKQGVDKKPKEDK